MFPLASELFNFEHATSLNTLLARSELLKIHFDSKFKFFVMKIGVCKHAAFYENNSI